ncbi:serpin family protein [Altererythrobacter arenosus]|uniref:Serpin family protein n=1 Tax=Altererythrobacter arenosus TaxID=3032592 RepID=A0ABY8FML5_9SPHN|nr:serpin family protein [Altererythrobacter sp. CAU 1644]WFL76012.1 serpin family protein [Altererythrobacter sp. CAU 1644]
MTRHLLLLAPLALAACATTEPVATSPDSIVERDGSGAMALFPILDREAGPKENIVYSPASVDQAFGLLRLGAAGSTAEQLDRVLPAPRNADYLRVDKDDVEVRIANALFLSDAFRFRQSFVSSAKSRYDATTQAVDFLTPAPTAKTINDWAEKATEGLIPQVITPGSITPDMVAVLANALYFDGRWETKLTHGDIRAFLFGDGSEKPFRFVGKVLSLNKVEADGWSAVRIPYANDRYTMDVIIPEKRRVMAEAPSPEMIEELGAKLAGEKHQLVDLLIPQFEVDYSTGLIPALQALGVTAPFEKGVADLSPMAEPGQAPLVVSDARHVTKLQVFDAGTRAAAVTTISIVVTSGAIYEKEPVPFIADRPFVIVIRDLEAREVLFVGRIASPEAFEPEVIE